MARKRKAQPRRRKLILGSDSPRRGDFYGSDIRVKGGVEGQCVLCFEDRRLRLGHIVPKWAYSAHKREGGIPGQYPSLGITTNEQDGAKHYLLCPRCEQYLGRAEDYVARLMAFDDASLASIGVSAEPALDNAWLLSGLRPVMLQRFLLGVAYKMHFAEAPPFHDFELTELLLEQVRMTIQHDSFHPSELRMVLVRYYTECPGADPRAMMIPGISQRSLQTLAFDFHVGGWSIVGSFRSDLAERLPAYMEDPLVWMGDSRQLLTEGGTCYVAETEMMDDPMIKRALESWRSMVSMGGSQAAGDREQANQQPR